MLNHVELLGRLAQEPEIRYTQSGTPVASFDLAVQVPSKNKDRTISRSCAGENAPSFAAATSPKAARS